MSIGGVEGQTSLGAGHGPTLTLLEREMRSKNPVLPPKT